MLERFFALKEHETTWSREMIAGLTTFAAMAYILAVNPLILSTTGIDKGALVTATAVASAVMTIIMALATNYPIALAPGMGLNAFFAFTICAGKGIPWQAALGLVFYGGLIFLLLSVSGLRKRIVEAIPFV
jgi:AGZA family xanthine/uracil permease-like MFS transporter